MVDISGARNIRGCKPSRKYQKYYDKINKLYFDGTLPPATVLVAPLLKITQLTQKEVEENDWLDGGEYGLVGYTEEGIACIILDKGTAVFHPLITYQTVCHEAIHLAIGLQKGHGKLFKQQIRRIAALGAFDTLI